MEKQILVKVFSSMYEDNYENGEVVGTYSRVKIDEKTFPTLEEAEAWADNEYSEVGPKEYDGAILYYGNLFFMDKDGWMKEPTEEQKEDFEKSKINLWDKEVEVHCYEVTELEFTKKN